MPLAQRLFESPPGSGGNNGALPTVYDPTWQSYTNLTPQQQAWFRSQPQWLVTYAGIRRWMKEINGITFNGISIDTNDSNGSKALIDGLAIRAMRDQQNNPSAIYTFTSKGNAYQLGVTQALALFDAVSGYIQSCRAVEGQAIANINAIPPTITTEAQIDAALATVPTSY